MLGEGSTQYLIPFEAWVSYLVSERPVSAICHCSALSKGQPGMILTQFLALGAILFSLGIYGLLSRRNAVTVLLAVELMLAAVNINLVAFEAFWNTAAAHGQIFAIFVITDRCRRGRDRPGHHPAGLP